MIINSLLCVLQTSNEADDQPISHEAKAEAHYQTPPTQHLVSIADAPSPSYDTLTTTLTHLYGMMTAVLESVLQGGSKDPPYLRSNPNDSSIGNGAYS